VVKREGLPHTEVRICVHVSLTLKLADFGAKVLHDRTRLAVLRDVYDASKLHIILLFSRQGRPYSDNHFEVLIAARELRLEERWLNEV